MIPDLLLALLGVSGDVFVPDVDADGAETLVVAKDLDFIQPHERQRLNSLATLGASYAAIDRMARREQLSVSVSTSKTSLYRRALAIGLTEVLGSYEAKILKLEQDALRRGASGGTIGEIESALSDERIMLPTLCSHYGDVFRAGSEVSGGDVVRRARETWLRCGHPATRAACETLYWKVNQVMMQQLVGWCAYGKLVDPNDEFFIRAVDPKGLMTKDGEEDDGSKIWHESYKVALERLPPGVELAAAESVSFIGRSVRILTHRSGDLGASSSSFDAEDFAKRATAMIRGLAATGGFDPREFESVVERMRSDVAETLGRVLLNDSGLVAHLDDMCGFYFLGKGDLYSTFFDEASSLLSLAPKPGSATRDLSVPFSQAMMLAHQENDGNFSSSFRLVYTSALTQSMEKASTDTPSAAFAPRVNVPDYDAWDGIGLECSVQWPLGIFLTADALDRYKTIFKYLFRLRRVQYDLQQVWVLLRRSDLTRTLQLRHSMNLLIENWRAYIQVDVIEPEFQKLLQTINSSTDFNKCTRAHRQYLAAVMAHSFLDVGSIMTIFEDIFALAREIFSTCSQYSSGQGLPADWEDRLSYLSRQFEKNSQELLTNLRAYVVEVPALRSFLLRMNFNYHFENGSEGVNLTATQFDGLEL